MVTCGCGSTLKKMTSAHIKTKKHQKWLSETNQSTVSPPSVSPPSVSPPSVSPPSVSPPIGGVVPINIYEHVTDLSKIQAERFQSIQEDEKEQALLCLSEEHSQNFQKFKNLSGSRKQQLKQSIPESDRLPVKLDDEDVPTQGKKKGKFSRLRKEVMDERKEQVKRRKNESKAHWDIRRDLIKAKRRNQQDPEKLLSFKEENSSDYSSRILDIKRRQKVLAN